MRPKQDKDKREKATVMWRRKVNKPKKEKSQNQIQHVSLLLDFTDTTRPNKVNGPGVMGLPLCLASPSWQDHGMISSQAPFSDHSITPTQINWTFTKHVKEEQQDRFCTVIQLQKIQRWEKRTLMPSSKMEHRGERGLGMRLR